MRNDGVKNDLPEMTENTKNERDSLDDSVKKQDIDGLFQLSDNSYFSIALLEILNSRCNMNPARLNRTQRVLFLCMHLENAGQTDSILGFLQEDYPEYANETVNALNAIGATKSAEIIKQAIRLLPKDGSWFFDHADEKAEQLMDKLDRDFSDYPDGLMGYLYRKYADIHRNDLYEQ